MTDRNGQWNYTQVTGLLYTMHREKEPFYSVTPNALFQKLQTKIPSTVFSTVFWTADSEVAQIVYEWTLS